MSTETIDYRFKARGGTAANLAAVNEIPLRRELVVEIDTAKAKVGDGVTPYNDLAYIGGEGGGGAAWHNGEEAPASGLGVDGDYYLRASNGDVYEKDAGTWSVVANIRGPSGPAIELRVDSGYIQWRVEGSGGWTNLIAESDLQGEPGPPGPSSSTFPTASFSATGGDIAVGTRCILPIPFGFTITGYVLASAQEGTMGVDVLVDGASIVGPSPPTLVGGNYVEDNTISGWSAEVAAGSRIEFIITHSSGISVATLVLKGVRDA